MPCRHGRRVRGAPGGDLADRRGGRGLAEADQQRVVAGQEQVHLVRAEGLCAVDGADPGLGVLVLALRHEEEFEVELAETVLHAADPGRVPGHRELGGRTAGHVVEQVRAQRVAPAGAAAVPDLVEDRFGRHARVAEALQEDRTGPVDQPLERLRRIHLHPQRQYVDVVAHRALLPRRADADRRADHDVLPRAVPRQQQRVRGQQDHGLRGPQLALEPGDHRAGRRRQRVPGAAARQIGRLRGRVAEPQAALGRPVAAQLLAPELHARRARLGLLGRGDRRRRVVAVGRLVRADQLAQQGDRRHRVEDQVVQGHAHHRAGGRGEQRRAQQRRAVQRERRRDELLHRRLELRRIQAGGRDLQHVHGDRGGVGGVQHPAGQLGLTGAEHRPQDLVLAHHEGERPPERGPVQRAVHVEGQGEVVDARPGDQPFQQPQVGLLASGGSPVRIQSSHDRISSYVIRA